MYTANEIEKKDTIEWKEEGDKNKNRRKKNCFVQSESVLVQDRERESAPQNGERSYCTIAKASVG